MRYLFMLAMIQPCLGMDISTFVSTVYTEPGKFAVRSVRFQLPSEIQRVHSITYGNPYVGFFRVNQFLFKGPSIEFEIIPPGYREATQFLVTASTRDGRRRIFKRTRRFHSPFPLAFREIEATHFQGRFSAPFFFLHSQAGAPLSKASDRLNTHKTTTPNRTYRLAAIINRCGELVYTLPTYHAGRSTFAFLDNNGLFRSI